MAPTGQAIEVAEDGGGVPEVARSRRHLKTTKRRFPFNLGSYRRKLVAQRTVT